MLRALSSFSFPMPVKAAQKHRKTMLFCYRSSTIKEVLNMLYKESVTAIRVFG